MKLSDIKAGDTIRFIKHGGKPGLFGDGETGHYSPLYKVVQESDELYVIELDMDLDSAVLLKDAVRYYDEVEILRIKKGKQ